jgi:hypothetical protein
MPGQGIMAFNKILFEISLDAGLLGEALKRPGPEKYQPPDKDRGLGYRGAMVGSTFARHFPICDMYKSFSPPGQRILIRARSR